MLLRKSLLEEELLMNQLHYEKVFRSQYIMSGTKEDINLILQGIEVDINAIKKDLEFYNK